MFFGLYYSDVSFWLKIIRHEKKPRFSVRIYIFTKLIDILICVSAGKHSSEYIILYYTGQRRIITLYAWKY